MALLKDYEIPGTGVVIENAYHVVTDIKVEKRMQDTPAPPDPTRPNGLTFGANSPETAVYWKSGYTAELGVTIWKNKTSREVGAKPIGFIGKNPADNKYGVSIGTAGMDHRCVFLLEAPSELDHMAQAYRHLLTTDYYSGSLEV